MISLVAFIEQKGNNYNDNYVTSMIAFKRNSGGVVVKLLACGARGLSSIPVSPLRFHRLVTSAFKSRYGWNNNQPVCVYIASALIRILVLLFAFRTDFTYMVAKE